MQVGLAPLPGPRGLLRIYAPYLGQEPEEMINFIAVEPTPAGGTQRGYSELEWSGLDAVYGKRFWSAEDPDDPAPLASDRVAPGTVDVVDGVERLRVHVGVERFENGAHVALRLTFRADRPHEVAIAAFQRRDSVPLEACVLSATMGNYARLRRLHLADEVVHVQDLWPDFSGEGFTGHARFPLGALARVGGAAVIAATTDEPEPERATHEVGTAPHWRYRGTTAVQWWRVEDPGDGLMAQVNARATYWASASTIPGGIAFENFELVEPFRQGHELTFAVTPAARDGLGPLSGR